jgi:hypothetical protein
LVHARSTAKRSRSANDIRWKSHFRFSCGGSTSDWRPNLDNIKLMEVIGPSAGGRIGKSDLLLR